jgi:hypothetical protein
LVTAEGAPLPVAVCVGAREPEIATAALAGVPTVAPALGFDRATVKDFVPVKGVVFIIGTEKLFVAVSPLAQLTVPLTAV